MEKKTLGETRLSRGGTLCSKVLSDCAEDSSGSRGLVPMAQFNKLYGVYKCYFKHYALLCLFYCFEETCISNILLYAPSCGLRREDKSPPPPPPN